MSTEMEPTRALSQRLRTAALAAEAQPERLVLAERYELGGVLGHGGVGTVHLARDLVLDRDVAVKLFRADAAVPDQAERYQQEARLLGSLSHPGLVMVFDAGIDVSVAEHPKPYLVMELIDGPTLAERLRDGALSTAQTLALGSQLATALAYVHRCGVVHRDVKPANILLAHDSGGLAAAAGAEPDRFSTPTAKLTDFGIARLVDSTRMTVHGLTLGTPNYLSPEQATGGEVGPPTDVYALGLVLLECVTGQVVYPGHGIEAAVVRLHRPPVFPAWLDPECARLLMAMTHSDPVQRPSAAEAAQVLANLPGSTTETPATAVANAPTQVLAAAVAAGSTRTLAALPAQRRVRWWWLVAALVGALLIIMIAFVIHDRTPSSQVGPRYPSVPGQMGNHLHQLQKAVQP